MGKQSYSFGDYVSQLHRGEILLFIINNQGTPTLVVFVVSPSADIRSDAVGMSFAFIYRKVVGLITSNREKSKGNQVTSPEFMPENVAIDQLELFSPTLGVSWFYDRFERFTI